MDWFKHNTTSIDDPDIQEAEDLFGDAGYAVFFKILEIYGKEFSHLQDGKLSISCAVLRRKLRKSWTKVQQILRFYEEKNRIFSEIHQNQITIEIPKYLKMASNWTTRNKGANSPAPTEAPTEAPHAREGEGEEEVEGESFKKAEGLPPPPPSKDEIDNASIVKLKEQIKSVSDELYDKKIFPKVHMWVNKQIKDNKNQRAILHTLIRCLMKGSFQQNGGAVAYCTKILKVENGNYNERDHQKNY